MTESQRAVVDALKIRIVNMRGGGRTDVQIRAGLIAEGWCPQSVDAAFKEVDG